MDKIKILNPVFAKASKTLLPDIRKVLKYEDSHWRKKHCGFGLEEKRKLKFMVDGRNGVFLTGLIPKVVEHLESIGKEFKHFPIKSIELNAPYLTNVKLRDYQEKVCLLLLKQNVSRGLIIHPTGTGKTTIIMAIISQLPKNFKTLLLCHRVDIREQLAERCESVGLGIPYVVKNSKDVGFQDASVVISTHQTFSRIKQVHYGDLFNVIIVDEAHHANSVSCQIAKIMMKSLALLRFGFTATIHKERKKALTMEGLFGPVIDRILPNEAEEIGVLAKIEISLVQIPKLPEVKKYQGKYSQIYKFGIVENRTRNKIIVEKALKEVEFGKSVLIMVREINHGKNISKIARLLGHKLKFVRGKTDTSIRLKIKQMLIEKKLKCVICTDVWKEGVDIPTLDVLINAVGGESELQTIQATGRLLRKVEGQEVVRLYDFLDPYRFLAEHTISRLSTYKENKWL